MSVVEARDVVLVGLLARQERVERSIELDVLSARIVVEELEVLRIGGNLQRLDAAERGLRERETPLVFIGTVHPRTAFATATRQADGPPRRSGRRTVG